MGLLVENRAGDAWSCTWDTPMGSQEAGSTGGGVPGDGIHTGAVQASYSHRRERTRRETILCEPLWPCNIILRV